MGRWLRVGASEQASALLVSDGHLCTALPFCTSPFTRTAASFVRSFAPRRSACHLGESWARVLSHPPSLPRSPSRSLKQRRSEGGRLRGDYLFCAPHRHRDPCLPAAPVLCAAAAVIIKDDDDGDGSSPLCPRERERGPSRVGTQAGRQSAKTARSLLLSLSGGLIAAVITICADDDECEYCASLSDGRLANSQVRTALLSRRRPGY